MLPAYMFASLHDELHSVTSPKLHRKNRNCTMVVNPGAHTLLDLLAICRDCTSMPSLGSSPSVFAVYSVLSHVLNQSLLEAVANRIFEQRERSSCSHLEDKPR